MTVGTTVYGGERIGAVHMQRQVAVLTEMQSQRQKRESEESELMGTDDRLVVFHYHNHMAQTDRSGNEEKGYEDWRAMNMMKKSNSL